MPAQVKMTGERDGESVTGNTAWKACSTGAGVAKSAVAAGKTKQGR